MRTELRKLRIDNEYTVKEIVNMLNISASHYYSIERGARNPNMKLAKRLEIIFNTPMEELFSDIFEDINRTS